MSSLPRGGSYPSTVVPTGAKHRVQSPLERWPCTISTDRPEMESRPYEFLLQFEHSLGMNSRKRQNDRTLKDELPRSVGDQDANGDQWRNKSR